MVLGVGVDLFEVGRMEGQARAGGGEFLEALFTPGEIAYCTQKRYPAQHFAARFAAKEAFFKALGKDSDAGIPWREVEVRNDPSGHPDLVLHGTTARTARDRRVDAVHLSLSHTAEMAIAQVVLESHSEVHDAGAQVEA